MAPCLLALPATHDGFRTGRQQRAEERPRAARGQHPRLTVRFGKAETPESTVFRLRLRRTQEKEVPGEGGLDRLDAIEDHEDLPRAAQIEDLPGDFLRLLRAVPLRQVRRGVGVVLRVLEGGDVAPFARPRPRLVDMAQESAVV